MFVLHSQGYPVPSNFNPADHYINILASMNSSKNDLRDLTLNVRCSSPKIENMLTVILGLNKTLKL